MQLWLTLLAAFALFLLGLWLSAFFSGAETGFYRVSFLRLNIDAQSGDAVAKRLLWFAQHPSYFVATTLVGNNVANYLTTIAIGIATATLFRGAFDWMEVIATLLLSPVIFVFGELLPKNLHYRAPLYLLRKGSAWFVFFYRLFLVVSLPLIGVSNLLQRLSRVDHKALNLTLRRQQLAQVLHEGHQEGLLTEVQNRLVNGLLQTAAQPIADTMTPSDRVLGVEEGTPRDEILEYARKMGVTKVAVRQSGADKGWYGYLRVADLSLLQDSPRTLLRPMPRIPHTAGKLEALLALRNADASYGVIVADDEVQGVISERGLIEQLFHATAI